MNCTAWSEKLHAYVDGELAPADVPTLESHLAECGDCQRALASLRALRAATAQLDREIAPERDLWPEIRSQVERGIPAALRSANVISQTSAAGTPRSTLHWLLPLAVAASIAALFSVAHRLPSPVVGTGWRVDALAGAPRINARAIAGTGQLHVGQWLVTDRTSRAKVEVGAIGTLDLEPNSRLRLVNTEKTDHRINLARGELRALIWAPPRIFFVNTPSATAVDLGCAYDLKVADDGSGLLRVTFGYVALQHNGLESIIPSGLVCQTRQGTGPGTPYQPGAPPPLIAALERFDFGPVNRRATALDDVIRQARADDYVMLWHLLSRAAPAQRGAVFDTLVKSHPAPAGVTRAGIVADDHAMREIWAQELKLRNF